MQGLSVIDLQNGSRMYYISGVRGIFGISKKNWILGRGGGEIVRHVFCSKKSQGPFQNSKWRKIGTRRSYSDGGELETSLLDKIPGELWRNINWND